MQAEEEGMMMLAYIPKGCTSIMQVCDLVSNHEIKQNLKGPYILHGLAQCSRHQKEHGHRNMKNKLPRETVMNWVATCFATLNLQKKNSPTIRNIFN